MKILFINASGLQYDVATPDVKPLGGTESSICYLARELASRGHTIFLAGGDHHKNVMNVTHVNFNAINDHNFFNTLDFDVIVVPSKPRLFLHLNKMAPLAKKVLWNHMAPDQPALALLAENDVANAIDMIVYVSHSQKELTQKQFLTNHKAMVIGNGLTPSFENLFDNIDDFVQQKQFEAAYTSTPFRGLNMLPYIQSQLSPAPLLKVYSSMAVYQAPDDEFKELYQQFNDSIFSKYEGSLSQAALASAMRAVSFFPYPCMFLETFCIATLEAMAAGAKIISTDLGALKETTLGYADLITIDTTHIDMYINSFVEKYAIHIQHYQEDKQDFLKPQWEAVQCVNALHTWRNRATDWDNLLQLMLANNDNG